VQFWTTVYSAIRSAAVVRIIWYESSELRQNATAGVNYAGSFRAWPGSAVKISLLQNSHHRNPALHFSPSDSVRHGG
jgi:hypothetical protein